MASKEGWILLLTMRKLDKRVEQFGEQVNEEVGRTTFTGDGETCVIRPPGALVIGAAGLAAGLAALFLRRERARVRA